MQALVRPVGEQGFHDAVPLPCPVQRCSVQRCPGRSLLSLTLSLTLPHSLSYSHSHSLLSEVDRKDITENCAMAVAMAPSWLEAHPLAIDFNPLSRTREGI
jgi:hypothetical protein